MKYAPILFLVVILAISATAFGQTADDKILVSGDPVLTQSTVSRVQSVFEWVFKTNFSVEQSAEFRLLLIDYWQRGSRTDINICLDYLKIADVIAVVPSNRAEEARSKLRNIIVTVIKQRADDPMSRLLTKVYEDSKRLNVDRDEADKKFRMPAESNRNFPPKLIAE